MWVINLCLSTTVESSLSEGLGGDEEDDENPNSDPFIPQERIFSKYAAMFYTSDNNGKTFQEFKDAKFCPSCGEKVDMIKIHFVVNHYIYISVLVLANYHDITVHILKYGNN